MSRNDQKTKRVIWHIKAIYSITLREIHGLPNTIVATETLMLQSIGIRRYNKSAIIKYKI
jgi:hypothetical protein